MTGQKLRSWQKTRFEMDKEFYKKYKLIIFDLDGTLVRDYNSYTLLPGRAKFFSQPDLPPICLATNQGGVGLRYWMESGNWGDPVELPTIQVVETRLAMIDFPPGFNPDILMCFTFKSKAGKWSPTPPGSENDSRWQQDWRKPSPGMLLDAMNLHQALPANTLMVGDSDDDRLAAEAAGCDFALADSFFNPWKTTLQFTYHSQFVYGWLREEERIGLDIISTLARFERGVREALGNWYHIGSVAFCRNDSDPDLAFQIGPLDELGDEVEAIGRQVLDYNINRHWLVYQDAEAHARALAFCRDPNLQITLVQDIASAGYGLEYWQARDLVESIREELKYARK